MTPFTVLPYAKRPSFAVAQSSISQLRLQEPIALIISSYPPRECGIATYTKDLISAIRSKYNSFDL